MSLLDRGPEIVTVYPEVQDEDSDGNKRTRPGSIGVVVRASVQPITSSENTDGSAFNTTTRYRLRLAGGWPTGGGVLGAQSAVEWRGKRYTIDGDAQLHTGSRRTAHAVYVMSRT